MKFTQTEDLQFEKFFFQIYSETPHNAGISLTKGSE